MAGTITDVFSQASSGTAPLASTLTAQKAIGASSLSVAASTGWPTASNSAIWFKLYQATTVSTAQGNLLVPVSGTETLWKGLLSGLTANSLTLTSGTDQLYPIGSIVEPMFTSSQMDAMYTGLVNEHNQTNGTHNAAAASTIASQFASNAIATSKIATDAGLTGASLATNAVKAANLDTAAITLGYAQITSTFSTSSNTATQVTGLTATVTIPSGGRRIKITAFGSAFNVTSGTNVYTFMTIWDGAVGTGTALSNTQAYEAGANQTNGNPIIMAIVSPSAGSKTYNVSLHCTSGGTQLIAATTAPAFILVEAI